RDDTGKFRVEAIDIPDVPRPLSERPMPPVAVDAAVLDRYVGYYEGFLDTRARDFSSILAFRRDGGNLVLDWHAGGSDRSFVLFPLGETAFSTLRRYESRLFGKPSVDVYFSEGPQGMVVSIGTSQDVPAVVAGAVDTSLAQEMLADIDRRMTENLPARGSREIVDAIVERLLNGDVGGDSLADMAARVLGEQLEAWRPTTLASRGELEGIALERVLRSGRDVYAVRFANLALEITVVNGIQSAVDGVLLDAFCRRRGETARSELEPCIAP